MTIIDDQTREAMKAWWNTEEESRYEYGYIGKALGNGQYEYNVPYSPGKVFVRLATTEGNESSVIEAVNFGALPNPRMLLRLVRIAGEWVIDKPVPYSARKLYGNLASAAATAPTIHTIGSGNEDLVEDRRFLPGLVFPSAAGGMLATIYAFDYPGGYWESTDVDLTSAIPATAGTKRLVIIGVNANSGLPFVIAGPEVDTSTTLSKADTVSIDTGDDSRMPLAATVLTNGQTSLNGNDPWFDMRRWGVAPRLQAVDQNTVDTTDATATAIDSIATTTDTSLLISAHVVGRRTGGAAGAAGDSAGYVVKGTFKNIAGTVSQVGSTQKEAMEDQGAWDVDFNVNGTEVEIQVTGAADNAVSWKCTRETTEL